MKSLKGLLKESNIWDREFGEPLPTLEDTTRRYKEKLKEVDYEKVTVPAQVKRFMSRFIDAVKGANLNRIKRIAILFGVIKALGISPQELQQYVQRVKREI